MADDSLPIGVGRVPQWWMDCTPHYILDLEEDQARRQAEQQMAYYFEQMAKAADAGYLDENGNPIVGPDGKPLMDWSSGGGNNGWQGRGPGGGGGVGFGPVDGPLGRNFVPGRVTPESLALLGITESDPNYQIYLSGKKYPPGYWNKLADLGYLGPGITANNLHQTDFGRYGRQAEVPKHKPAWAKMKLKTTSTGQNIRQGKYEDSPGDTMRRAKGDGSSQNTAYNHEEAPPSPVASPQSLRPTPVAAPAPAPEPAPAPVAAPAPAPVVVVVAAAPDPAPAAEGKKKRLVRKVRKVRRKKPEGEPTVVMEAADEQRARSGAYKPGEVPMGPSTIRTTPAQQPQYQQQQQQAQNHEEEEYSEAFEEEEVIEDEEPLEESEYFEEEVLDDDDDHHHHHHNHQNHYQQQHIQEVPPPAPAPAPAATPDISDLQAILAAKQAELARLQASLGS